MQEELSPWALPNIIPIPVRKVLALLSLVMRESHKIPLWKAEFV